MKREPTQGETYTTKENEEVEVKYYDTKKQMVTYTHNGNQYTRKLSGFIALLAKWSR